ncbi:MAG: VWA domain-containing protein [Gammaproteobacteria bacterium]|nr:VWA domain-containing protein [Gammaproteobacteria bacterium]MDH3768778.1 VWA domain-containing protein [Gammaproteobacteria bacterium]
MARKQRRFTVFSLSFLDIMSCGFGATVLVFMLIHHSTVERADEINKELLIEVDSLTREITSTEIAISNASTEIEKSDNALVQLKARTAQATEELARARDELANRNEMTMAQREHLSKLMADVQALEEQTKRLEGEVEERRLTTADGLSFVGEGDRQYLTGLKLGGRRLLIILDASASMLDTTLVNIIRTRNMPLERKLQADKWVRSLRTVEWILTRLPETTEFQVFIFNETARPLISGTENEWFASDDQKAVGRAAAALRLVDPGKGTSLYQAFNVVGQLDPMPDNVVLITDGLPTVGDAPPKRRTISSRNRIRLFQRSLQVLPSGIPVNTILFPIEGDPAASSQFWRLAMATGGSLMSPSRDWP